MQAVKLSALGVVTDGAQDVTKRRTDNQTHEEQAYEAHTAHKIVQTSEGDIGDPGWYWEALQAIVTAGEAIPLLHNGEEHLGEAQRQQGKIDLRQAHAEKTHHQSNQRTEHRSQGQRRVIRDASAHREYRHGIGADPEIRRLTKRQHTAEAEQQVDT